jgi:hypothetical protein
MRAASIAAVLGAALIAGAQSRDPMAVELERWSAMPAAARAREAFAAGRRHLALQRLAAAITDLEASAYVESLTADQKKDLPRFEKEWQRLRPALATPSPKVLNEIRPAATRAVAEAAFPQIRGYYEASLAYGRSTTAEAGLYYLRAAEAQKRFIDLARALSAPTKLQPPPLRSIAVELDALENALLAAYRPPVSIDKHQEFIATSALLKEARELDAAGLRYGALLRYLQAAFRATPLHPPATDATSQLRGFEALIASSNIDHSIGQIFVESAQSAATPEAAAPIVTFVLPRYLAALEPAIPSKAEPAPRSTITLVRWPYT